MGLVDGSREACTIRPPLVGEGVLDFCGLIRQSKESYPGLSDAANMTQKILQNSFKIVYTEVQNSKISRLQRALCSAGDFLNF